MNKTHIRKTKRSTTEKIGRFYTLRHSIMGEKVKLAAIKSQTITVPLPLCVNSNVRWRPIASYSGRTSAIPQILTLIDASSFQSAEVHIPLISHGRTATGKR